MTDFIDIDSRINVKIGNGVYIGAGSQIGVLPFVFDFEQGEIYRTFRKDPALELEIGDNVFIGANCTIQTGFWGKTIIGDHVKIDHNCNIAHDCVIGDRSVLTLGTSLGGRVEIGHDSYCGIETKVKPKVKIGNRCLIGMGSNVTKDIPDGMVAWGNPCKPMRKNEWYPPHYSEFYPDSL